MRRGLALLAAVVTLACGGNGQDAGRAAMPAADPDAPTAGEPDDGAAAFWLVFRAAAEARRDGNRGAALLGYERALQLQPEHPDSLYYVAQLRYERGELAQARERLVRLAELEPRALRSWQQLSVVDGSPLPGWTADLDSAAAAAEQSLQLYPSESRNHYLAARWAAYAGDLDRATALLDTALGHNSMSWPSHLLRIWVARQRGDAAAAARLRDELRVRACGQDGARCATFDPLADILAAAAVPEAANAGVSALAGRAVGLDIDGDGSSDARFLQGSARQLLVLPIGHGAQASGPRPVPARGVALRGAGQPPLLLASGQAVRAYEIAEDTARPVEHSIGELVPALTMPVLAAGDIDADGLDDLLVANVSLADGALAGLLLRGLPGGRFESAQSFVGPLTAAHFADLDGDGDDDLLLARDVRGDLIAGSVLERVVGSDPPVAAPPPPVSFWNNDGGRFTPDPTALPPLWSPANSLATVDADADGRLDIVIATGGPAPERPAPDRLWLQTDDGFQDASARLGDRGMGATWSAWIDASGNLVLVRGGAVPAAPLALVPVVLR